MAALLELKNLNKGFPTRLSFFKTQWKEVLKNVNFSIEQGEIVALVGESGSGKSTIGRLILGLDQPNDGTIRFEGNLISRKRKSQMQEYRKRVQMVFQDPFASLNPVHTILYHLSRPLHRLLKIPKKNQLGRVYELLSSVGLEPPERMALAHPHELSGGQRQRVAIARALAAEPKLIVADEPTSMLDVSIRMDILNLIAKLRDEKNISVLLITHDLASAAYLSDRVIVLQKGEIVEQGSTQEIIKNPQHPYTKALLAAVQDREISNVSGERGVQPNSSENQWSRVALDRESDKNFFSTLKTESVSGLNDNHYPFAKGRGFL